MNPSTLKSPAAALANIADRYKILLADDVPVLFTGFNIFGNRIIGSFLDDDDEQVQFLHCLISEADFLEFKAQRTTLHDLYSTNPLFLRLENGSTITFRNADWSEVPIDARPAADSFCPYYSTEPSFEYGVSLQGIDATEHHAIPEELSELQNRYANLLRNAVKNLVRAARARVTIPAYAPGSFRINFLIEFQSDQLELFPEHYRTELQQLFQDYLEYPVNHLPNEIKSAFSANTNTQNLDSLIERLQRNKEKDRKIRTYTRESLLPKIVELARQYQDIADISGKHYSQIHIANKNFDGHEEPIAFLTENSGENLNEAIEFYEKNAEGYEEDLEATNYVIRIYALNVDSRKGKAALKEPGSKRTVKPNIHILGTIPLRGSKFTESLHNGTEISVQAKGKRIKRRLISLSIVE